MLLAAKGGVSLDLFDEEIERLFSRALSGALKEVKGSGPVLILPPDITRFYSRAGFLTDIAAGVLGARLGAVMPALGTHMAMTGEELARMFPKTPKDKFLVHDWRNDVATMGRIEGAWLEKATEGKVKYDWPVQVNKLLLSGGFSMIVSLGQVVPHEVIGMANHTKNLFVGTGGKEAIDKSHFAGACYGMEKMMGRADTPVRALFDEGFKRFGDKIPPVLFAQTVIGPRSEAEASKAGKPRGSLAVRGLFAGFGRECFEEAAALSRQVNVDIIDEPIKKAVVYLEPEEFRTTWLGNKAVYRTRMAMEDSGELLILAPGLECFGEDMGVDKLIRKFGYCPSKVILEKAEKEKEIAENLSVAAHLIHGSSEGRFTVRYCPGPKVSRAEIKSVGYEWGSLDEAMARYDVKKLSLGWNTMPDGERIFFVPNPALGLWAERKRFNGES
jgi:nickel-dependent lactate racemase